MGLILDLILIAAVVYCGWRGFRTGLINGICGILAVVIAIYGANLLATAYSSEFTGILEPFATGIVESVQEELVSYAGSNDSSESEDVPVVPLTAEELKDPTKVSYSIFRELGFIEAVSEEMAWDIPQSSAETAGGLVDALTALLCQRVCFVVIFLIGFLLIGIIFAVLGNVLDLSFGIPGHENFNHISGSLLGVVQGVLLVLVITCICRYLGIILSDELLSRTWLVEKLVTTNKIASILGI